MAKITPIKLEDFLQGTNLKTPLKVIAGPKLDPNPGILETAISKLKSVGATHNIIPYELFNQASLLKKQYPENPLIDPESILESDPTLLVPGCFCCIEGHSEYKSFLKDIIEKSEAISIFGNESQKGYVEDFGYLDFLQGEKFKEGKCKVIIE
tara:strand:+ start:315 stop:773 length:459 start_codon:yes stop_codon:yes gene_type:complete